MSRKNRPRPWTRGEKWLWATPLLFAPLVMALTFGPEVARRAMHWPKAWKTLPDAQLRFLVLSDNGHVLATTGSLRTKKGWKRGSGTVFLWNARTGASLPSIPPVYTRDKTGFIRGSDPYGLTLSPDAKQLGLSRQRNEWMLYNLGTRKPAWYFPRFVGDAVFSRDGRFVVLSSDSDISVISADKGRVRTRWKRSGPSNSQDVDVSPDGKFVASIGPYKANDPIEIHRVADGKLVRQIQSEGTRSVRFSPDGKHLVVACSLTNWDSERDLMRWTPVRCFDVKTGALLWSVETRVFGGSDGSAQFFCDAIFSPDGKQIAAYQYIEKKVFLLESRTGKIQATLPLGRAERSMFFVPPALAFSPDGKRLFARGKDAILVWDIRE